MLTSYSEYESPDRLEDPELFFELDSDSNIYIYIYIVTLALIRIFGVLILILGLVMLLIVGGDQIMLHIKQGGYNVGWNEFQGAREKVKQSTTFNTTLWIIGQCLLDTKLVYYSLYFIFAVVATAYHPFFFSVHLTLILIKYL